MIAVLRVMACKQQLHRTPIRIQDRRLGLNQHPPETTDRRIEVSNRDEPFDELVMSRGAGKRGITQ